MTTKITLAPGTTPLSLLPPKVDIVFKMLFGDERNIEDLKKFLSAVLHLGAGELAEVFLTDTHLKQEYIEDKLGVLDVKAKLANGKVLDIEMQVRSVPEMRHRITYYNAAMITGQIGESGKYIDIKPAISIIITNYPLITESKKCHTRFRTLEVDEHFPFNDLQEINILDLTKIALETDDKLLGWLKFISSETEEDFMAVAANYPEISNALNSLKVISADAINRERYENRLKAQRDIWSIEDAAKIKGHAEGEANALQNFLQLLNSGLSVEEIKAKLVHDA